MSKELKRFLEQLEGKVKRQQELINIRSGKAEGIEKRELTEDESSEFDTLERDITDLKSKIELEKKFDKAAQRNAEQHFIDVRSESEVQEMEKSRADFSLLRALHLRAGNKPLDGLEKEMHDEAVKEAKESGITIKGIGLPSIVTRTNSVGSASNGGNTVATNLGEIIPALRPTYQTESLGATVMRGLVGDLDLPVGDGLATTNWTTESGTAPKTTPTTRMIELRPKRLAAFSEVTMQLLSQSSLSVEAWLRNELRDAKRKAVDYAALNGSGTGNVPTGILNFNGVNSIEIGTNGGVLTHELIVKMESLISSANADVANMSYLSTPGIRGKAKTTKLDANNSGFLWGADNTMNGYNAVTSTQVPSQLTKGTSTDCHALIFADWANLIIAEWGVMDIMVDPYTKLKDGIVNIVLNGFNDIDVKHAKGFCHIKDARVSA